MNDNPKLYGSVEPTRNEVKTVHGEMKEIRTLL